MSTLKLCPRQSRATQKNSEAPICSQLGLFAIFGGFVRNFDGVSAILFEVLLMEIQEKIHHFAGWEGGVKGHKNCEQTFCEQIGVSLIIKGRIIAIIKIAIKIMQP